VRLTKRIILCYRKQKGCDKMPSKKPQFVIRTEQDILDKISYIAKDNGEKRNARNSISYQVAHKRL